MELKDYQEKVLETLDTYLDTLRKEKESAFKVEQIKIANPTLNIPSPDFCAGAWNALKAKNLLPSSRVAIPYSPRTDGVNRFVPNVCLKIPTGGGKTLLAALGVTRIFSRYLSSNTGMVIWLVPNEAIYSQTKKHLTNRDHPYRQMLDRAAAGRVKILEKNSPLNSMDVDTHLCVMLLMLQSASRNDKDTLKLFRDRGNVHGFFPTEDDFVGHQELLQAIPNLSCYNNQDRNNLGSIIHDSIGNVMRSVQPVVIIDEGHKAFSKQAVETVYDFNPSFVLELSATPKDRVTDSPHTYANWLVDVRGAELAAEDMIKLPINVKVKAGDDWRDCLRESLEQLNKLQTDSDTLLANTSTYIRPILLVQVERTGKEQREAGYIHADDAKAFLLTAGINENEIAIKTSEVNDLKEPENQDLLSPTNAIRVIITKQALQEGWDCPFAYVLCSLATNRNLAAMTQLVGRVLRQPYATKTKTKSLDQCYVFCHHADTKEVVAGIKKSLEDDGMGDLVMQIKEGSTGSSGKNEKRKVERTTAFKGLHIFLPVVNFVSGKIVRPLDYESDILMHVDWEQINVTKFVETIPENVNLAKSQVTQINVTDGANGEFFQTAPAKSIDETILFDPVYATRIVSDIVPNPWQARKIIKDMLDAFKERGFDETKVGQLSSFILEELRKYLVIERDKLAEVLFISQVAKESIQFKLRTDTHNWEMPKHMLTDLAAKAPKLTRTNGDVVTMSLFSPTYQPDFNTDEEEFACYLDEQTALVWWHRNVAMSGQYFVQGWRKNKVYPDFIFAVAGSKMVVIETKGDQLDGNLDTEYKRKLLDTVTAKYSFDKTVKAGDLELILDDKTVVNCDLLLMSEWKTKLPKYL